MNMRDRERNPARASNLRWFFLGWVGVIFVWELLISFHLLLAMLSGPLCNQSPATANLSPQQMAKLKAAMAGGCSSLLWMKTGISTWLIIFFVALALLHIFLHWLALSKRFSQRLVWGYIPAQVCLIVVLGILAQQALDSTTLVFSLSLVLLLEIIGFFQQTQTSTIIIGSFVFVLFLICAWQLWIGGASDPLNFFYQLANQYSSALSPLCNWLSPSLPGSVPCQETCGTNASRTLPGSSTIAAGRDAH